MTIWLHPFILLLGHQYRTLEPWIFPLMLLFSLTPLYPTDLFSPDHLKVLTFPFMSFVAPPNLENCDHGWTNNKGNHQRDVTALPRTLCTCAHTGSVEFWDFPSLLEVDPLCQMPVAVRCCYLLGLKSCFEKSMGKELSKDPAVGCLHHELGC